MTPRAHEEHLSVVAVDLWLLGEVSPDDQRRYEQHVAACPACAERLEVRRADMDVFRRTILPKGVPEKVARRIRGARLWTALRGVALAGAAASVLVVAATRLRPSEEPAPALEPYTVKGSASLRVYVNREEGAVAYTERADLHAGDAIRFVVEPAGATWLLLVAVDGAGATHVYHPYQGKRSARLPTAGVFTVPGSIVLDETLGPERIFALLSREPLESDRVREELARVGKRGADGIRDTPRLPLPVDQVSFLVEKSPPPR